MKPEHLERLSAAMVMLASDHKGFAAKRAPRTSMPEADWKALLRARQSAHDALSRGELPGRVKLGQWKGGQ